MREVGAKVKNGKKKFKLVWLLLPVLGLALLVLFGKYYDAGAITGAAICTATCCVTAGWWTAAAALR